MKLVGISRIIGLPWRDLHVYHRHIETNIVKPGALAVSIVSNVLGNKLITGKQVNLFGIFWKLLSQKKLPKFTSATIAIFILQAYCKNTFKGKGEKCKNIKIRMNQEWSWKINVLKHQRIFSRKDLKYLISNLRLLQSTLQRLLHDSSEHLSQKTSINGFVWFTVIRSYFVWFIDYTTSEWQ